MYPKEITVNGIKLTVARWQKGGNDRLYIKEVGYNPGQACWDLTSGTWIKTHHEFGRIFKDTIQKALGL